MGPAPAPRPAARPRRGLRGNPRQPVPARPSAGPARGRGHGTRGRRPGPVFRGEAAARLPRRMLGGRRAWALWSMSAEFHRLQGAARQCEGQPSRTPSPARPARWHLGGARRGPLRGRAERSAAPGCAGLCGMEAEPGPRVLALPLLVRASETVGRPSARGRGRPTLPRQRSTLPLRPSPRAPARGPLNPRVACTPHPRECGDRRAWGSVRSRDRGQGRGQERHPTPSIFRDPRRPFPRLPGPPPRLPPQPGAGGFLKFAGALVRGRQGGK